MVPFDRPHDLLLVFHCNCVSTSHHFQDIITYFPKFKDVNITRVSSKVVMTLTFFQYLCYTGVISFQLHLELGDFLVQFTQMPFNL